MPFTKIIVHAVWATKDRKLFLNKINKDSLCKHIREYAPTKGIFIHNINGHLDHLHCLLEIMPEQNIATIMNLLKGESSYWANKNLKFSEKFGWQDEYFAVSVSKSQFEAVNKYINQQDVHHTKKSFQAEYEEFLKKYEFEE